MTVKTPPIKPTLRGYLHQEAFFCTLGASVLLLIKSSNTLSFICGLIYSVSLLLLFGISAIYHRPQWNPQTRALLKRLDHSAIFILIAGTFTPVCVFALSEKSSHQLLSVVWSAAIAGVLQSIFWVKAPKYVTALFYVIMGWLALPYLSEIHMSHGNSQISLLLAGGVFYTLGAFFYALKKPNLFPGVFGYHELFHLLTIIAAGLHFAVVYQLIT
ncbi:MAG: PAQR family membrane homeostasis protein TrhA [Pseudobdellovibrio sp.]